MEYVGETQYLYGQEGRGLRHFKESSDIQNIHRNATTHLITSPPPCANLNFHSSHVLLHTAAKGGGPEKKDLYQQKQMVADDKKEEQRRKKDELKKNVSLWHT